MMAARAQLSINPDPRTVIPVVAHAVGVFGDEEKATRWMTTPLALLADRSPADLLATEEGRARVETILTRIEHNIHT